MSVAQRQKDVETSLLVENSRRPNSEDLITGRGVVRAAGEKTNLPVLVIQEAKPGMTLSSRRYLRHGVKVLALVRLSVALSPVSFHRFFLHDVRQIGRSF